MLVVTILITALVAGGVSIWRLFNPSGGDTAATASAGNWDRIVLVNTVSGDTNVVTAEGDPEAPTSGKGNVLNVVAGGNSFALITVDEVDVTTVRNTDLGIEIPASGTALEPDSVVTPLPVTNRIVLAIGPAAGGDLTVIRSEEGDYLSFGELTGQASPRFFVDSVRTDALGQHIAVADAKNFQTVVISDAATDPLYLAGLPLAVDDTTIATSQVVGTRADITLSNVTGANAGKRLTAVSTDLPSGGTLIDGVLYLVAQHGDVMRVRPDAKAVEKVGSVAIPADATEVSMAPAANGKALVVLSDKFEAVVGVDGTMLFSTPLTAPLTGPVTPITPEPGWACLPVGGLDSPHSLIDLTTGTQIADLSGTVIQGISADGCTVLTTKAGSTEVVNKQGTVALGRTQYAALAPDGRAVVRHTDSNTLDLVRITDSNTLDEPVDLTSVIPGTVPAVPTPTSTSTSAPRPTTAPTTASTSPSTTTVSTPTGASGASDAPPNLVVAFVES